ncbi:MAG: hypothetical protein HYV63_14435 [Candidatus Schekmanbacteria bacterium]|nr:hypothetical protein [Candidatus Schekmanbacteria bacterium]
MSAARRRGEWWRRARNQAHELEMAVAIQESWPETPFVPRHRRPDRFAVLLPVPRHEDRSGCSGHASGDARATEPWHDDCFLPSFLPSGDPAAGAARRARLS